MTRVPYNLSGLVFYYLVENGRTDERKALDAAVEDRKKEIEMILRLIAAGRGLRRPIGVPPRQPIPVTP